MILLNIFFKCVHQFDITAAHDVNQMMYTHPDNIGGQFHKV